MQNIIVKTEKLITHLVELILNDIDKLPAKIGGFSLIGIKLSAAGQLMYEKVCEWEKMIEAIAQFKTIIKKCYPKESDSPVIQSLLKQLDEIEFGSMEELRDFIDMILFHIYFSKGEDKVFDLEDELFYDDEKCQKLFDQKIFIPENWLDQLVICLNKKNASEDMILHSLTPDWMWPKCFRMLIELYNRTEEAIKNQSPS